MLRQFVTASAAGKELWLRERINDELDLRLDRREVARRYQRRTAPSVRPDALKKAWAMMTLRSEPVFT